MATTEPIIIPIEGQPEDFIADAKKVQAEMDKLSSTLKEAGVSQSAYNQAAAKSKQAFDDQAKAAQKSSLSITDFRSAYMIATDVVRVGQQVFDATYGAFARLTDTVRDLSLVSGESAENTSRFIQVLDDFGLSAEDATIAAKKLKASGLSPTVETLAQLADKFKEIDDPAKRFAFVTDNLGKGGAKWVNVLNQESAALRKVGAEVSANLIITEQDIKMREVQRLAMDDLKDSWEGFTVSLGKNTSNVIAMGIAHMRAMEILSQSGGTIKDYNEALNQAIAEQLESAQATVELNEALEATDEALKAVSKANAESITGAIEIQKTNDDYVKSQNEIIKQIDELTAKKAAMYPWEIEKIAETQGKIDELSDKYRENADVFAENMEKKFAMMAIEKIAMSDGVAGYSEAEFLKAQAILATTDIATAAAFNQQQAQVMLTDAVAASKISVEEFGSILAQVSADGVISVDEVSAAIEAVPSQKTVTFNIVTVGAPPNLDTSSGSSNAPVGTHRTSHAAGGSFVIPQSFGNEGFAMGNNATASGGETVTVTPKGGSNNADIISAINSSKLDANAIVRAMLKGMALAGR